MDTTPDTTPPAEAEEARIAAANAALYAAMDARLWARDVTNRKTVALRTRSGRIVNRPRP